MAVKKVQVVLPGRPSLSLPEAVAVYDVEAIRGADGVKVTLWPALS